MNNEMNKIGRELVDASETGDFTAQRGLVDELFPYIYIASKRMSLRAISRWLADEQGIKLSQVAIANAMKEQEKHWARMSETISHAADVFGGFHGVEPWAVLNSKELFEDFSSGPPDNLQQIDPDELDEARSNYLNAVRTLENEWYDLPVLVRKQCRRHLAFKNWDFYEGARK